MLNNSTSDSSVAIDSFWRWFQNHLADFESLNEPDSPFWDVAVDQLQQLDNHLWFEISDIAISPRELIITAEGHTASFPLVEALISQAPPLPHWKFIALKPPQGFDFITHYEDIVLDPKTFWFLPLKNPKNPEQLGLRVGIPHYNPKAQRQLQNAVLIILETALGERAAQADIQHVEVSALPASPEENGYIELPELPKYLLWNKCK